MNYRGQDDTGVKLRLYLENQLLIFTAYAVPAYAEFVLPVHHL